MTDMTKLDKRVNLQMFTEGDGGNGDGSTGSGNGSSSSNASYTYEQLEEIADARSNRAERSALATFFREKGLSEDEITAAISEFKTKREQSKPDVSNITKERDDALNKLKQYENEKTLSKLNVSSDDIDYVMFKISQLAKEGEKFEDTAKKFLKENSKYTSSNNGYRVSTGSTSDQNNNNNNNNSNNVINTTIRERFKR